jgi:hypothetical protein
MDNIPSRRGAVLASLGLGGALVLAGCGKSAPAGGMSRPPKT